MKMPNHEEIQTELELQILNKENFETFYIGNIKNETESTVISLAKTKRR